MNKIQKAAELVKGLVGCPYIFGAYGRKMYSSKGKGISFA